ncbi:MAG: hypothetical protein IPM26_10160 [Saprospiraceae bacterium]|nr:hypothetical protein [Saprospiraceae bacterium]
MVLGIRWFFYTWSYGIGNVGYYELGASGVLGLDYSFDDIPLNLSVDWAPTIVLLNNWGENWGLSRFRGGYGALTARYILKR